MAAKMFILAFAAVIWQAQSQNCGQIGITNLFPNPGDSASQNLYALSSSPMQLAIPISGDGCISLNLETFGLPATVIPAPPACSRSVNFCLEESPDLLAETSICRPISNIPGPCGPQIRPPQIYSVSEEICKPNICANERFNIPKPLLRPTLPNFGPSCALEGCLDCTPTSAGLSAFTGSISEANSCLGPLNLMTPKLPNPIFGINRITPNPYLGQSDLASAIFDGSINIAPCRPVPDIGRINYATPNVQTSTTTETTTVNKAGPYGGINGQAVSTTTSSNSEATSFVNVRPDCYTPGIFRGFNNQPGTVSSVATSEASASVTSPGTYSSNIFGTNISPAQTSIATSESSAVTTSNVGPSRVSTPGSVSTVATSEATASVRSPGIYSPNIFGTNITPAQTSVATAESSAVTTSKVGPTRVFTPTNYNNLVTPASVSSAANLEANSIATSNVLGSNVYGSSFNTAQSSANAESASFLNARPPAIWTPNYFGGLNSGGQTSVSASASSDASAFTNIGPSYTSVSRFPGFLSPTTQVSSYAEADSSASIGMSNPNLSNFAPVQTSSYSELATPNYFTKYNVAQPIVSSVATSEAASSTNMGSTLYGGSTTTSTSTASAVSSTTPTNAFSPCSYKPDCATSVTASEATGFSNLGSGFVANLNVAAPLYPLSGTSCISPEAVCSTRIPHTYSPCILRGSNNCGAPSTASVSADASSSINIGSNGFISNVAGFNNVLTPNTVSTVANSEATSIASTVSSNMPRNMAFPTKATATAESSSAANIVPLSSVSPNFYGGLSQTACLSNPVVAPAYLEPPIFFPNACSRTGFCNSIPPQTCGFDLSPSISVFEFSQPCLKSSLNPIATSLNELSEFISSIVPIIEIVDTINPCYSIPYDCADARSFGCASPAYTLGDSSSMAESNAGSSSVASSSAIAIDNTDNTAAISSSVATAEASTLTSLPSTTLVSQGVTSTTASSSSTSTVTDINNPLTPCDDEVISSSSVATSTSATTSSSSVSSISSSPSILYQNPCNIELAPVTLEVQIPSHFATTLSPNLCGYSSGLPTALSSCLPISTPPVVYELQIPSSIPAQLSCTLASSPSTGPVLCMNVEPVGLCSC